MKHHFSSDFIRFHLISSDFFSKKKINHYSFFYFYQNHFIFSASLEKELSIKTKFASTKIDLTELIAQQNSLYQEKKTLTFQQLHFVIGLTLFPKVCN